MGRAYEVRKASIQKTGAAKAKLYSMYAKEIYQVAKTGGTEIDANQHLKRLIEKAKKEQVPSDIVKRAMDKVGSGVDESYDTVRYEIFGPEGSTLLVDCLTDNVNRSVSSVRAALNKTHAKMGVSGSVAYQYDHLCIVGISGFNEEEVLNCLLEQEVEVDDIEMSGTMVMVYGNPQDLFKIKEAITKKRPDITFDVEEIVMLPKETICLTNESLEVFQKLLTMLDDIEDVQNVYHNVVL